MRFLAAAGLLLATFALAGGAGAPIPQASVPPFGAGQTWELKGADKVGTPLRWRFVLGRPQPEGSSSWSFTAGKGSLLFDRPHRAVRMTDRDPATYPASGGPITFCLGIWEGRGARGILVTAASLDDLNAQINLIPASAQHQIPASPGELIVAARTWGLKVGSCTLTRLK